MSKKIDKIMAKGGTTGEVLSALEHALADQSLAKAALLAEKELASDLNEIKRGISLLAKDLLMVQAALERILEKNGY